MIRSFIVGMTNELMRQYTRAPNMSLQLTRCVCLPRAATDAAHDSPRSTCSAPSPRPLWSIVFRGGILAAAFSREGAQLRLALAGSKSELTVMALSELEDLPEVAASEPLVRPKRASRRRTQTKRQPPYCVVLHNDDVNSFEFVVGVVRKVFHYGEPKAFRLTLAAHEQGRSILWSGSLEVAELKADQLKSCGPDPEMKSRGALPLSVTIERQDGA
jgi:ATP-dependent Clp protease adaptor protein ClpS